MPHAIVKLWSGKSEKQKAKLAAQITGVVVNTLDYGEEAVSAAMEEFAPEDWAEMVYKPNILSKLKQIYKKPGYDPL